jgi:hypothetical protein
VGVRSAHSSARATAISLAIHAAVIAGLLYLAPRPTPPVASPPLAAAITIALLDPPLSPRPGAGGNDIPAAPGKAQPLGLHGQAAPRSIRRAPRRADPYAELAITYDTPADPDRNGPGAPDGDPDSTGLRGHGTGLGLGLGAGGDGTGGLAIPEPPHPSLARDPQPKYDYNERRIIGSKQYRGKILLVELRVDARGAVYGARIVQGIEPRFDRKVVALGTTFEFFPALDARGQPTAGTYHWKFRVHLL